MRCGSRVDGELGSRRLYRWGGWALVRSCCWVAAKTQRDPTDHDSLFEAVEVTPRHVGEGGHDAEHAVLEAVGHLGWVVRQFGL